MRERTWAGRRARRGGVAAILAFGITATTVTMTPEPASAAPVTPPGMTVLLDSGAWSWFEDERAMVDFASNRLYVSAVADSPNPGEVVVGEINLADGARQLVSLGAHDLDDHNSAAIWEASSGEVLTAWSAHAADPIIRTHRRRTDGSWLRLPWILDTGAVTYNNLYSVLREDGTHQLYDFYRGSGFDPEAVVSNDAGRTWSSTGRVLRDPGDSDSQRPYVRYASRGDRIDLIATEEHPGDPGTTRQTSVYHGYIQDGILYKSDGTSLGRVGTSISVTSLTRIWQGTTVEEGWTVDLSYDPATRNPIAAISTYRTTDDHRYYVARWNGSTWQSQHLAYAGTALYTGQVHYTGLVALDPRDANHVVISTDADPVTGAALVSATDGRRHHELFDGWRQPDGSYTWTPLTQNSDVDNIRPVITTSPSGAWALAWLRGRYTTYTNYDLQVVGVVQRPDGSNVTAAATAPQRQVVSGISDPGPLAANGVPLAGDFDSHPAGDVFLYRSGTERDDLVIGDDGRYPIHAQPPTVNGTYTPFTGDFDNDGDSDILWYATGTDPDYLARSQPDGTFRTTATMAINGTYHPIPGDFDADGDTDILWYAKGTAQDYVWTTGPDGTWTAKATPAINGTYNPVAGDYDGDSDTDIFWYAAGTATDVMWLTGPGATWTTRSVQQVNGVYVPVGGNYDGDADDDIVWYAPGTAGDVLWITGPGPTWTAGAMGAVNGTYRAVADDFDNDGSDDILWYDNGTANEYVWYHSTVPLGTSQLWNLNL